MGIPGYAGNIPYLDLTSGGIRKEPLDAELAKTFIGGHGINNRLAYDLIPPDVQKARKAIACAGCPLADKELVKVAVGDLHEA